MKQKDSYQIPLKTLSEGFQQFEYQLDDSFFQQIETSEIKGGDVNVVVDVRKLNEDYELSFKIEGCVIVPCDRCLDDMNQDVFCEEKFLIKYGEEDIGDENTICLSETEFELDITWIIYELIAVNLPAKRTHENYECNEEMLQYLAKHSAEKTEKCSEESIDPRWNDLKKFINNNN